MRSWPSGSICFGLTLWVVAASIAVFPTFGTSRALGAVPIEQFSAVPGSTEAGGHPDLEVKFTVKNRLEQQSQSACNCEDAKDATVHFPAGFIGNPHATPQCSIADFSADKCPIDSQVGIANVVTAFLPFNSAVYNLVPPPDEAGLLGFKIFLFDTPQFTVLSSRTGGDYGLDATATSIYHGFSVPLKTFTQVLWGVPANPIHNPLRLNSEFNPNGKGVDLLCWHALFGERIRKHD